MLQRDDKLVPLELRIENRLLCYRLCNIPLFVVATSNKTSPHQMEKEKKSVRHIHQKLKISLGFRSRRKSQHAKSISAMWWGHEFQPIWNCQAVRMRYNVAIKRGGMMIMHFDSRLPRQERPSQKKRERERERERNDRSNVTSLPSFSAGQWKIHLHCSTSVCSFQLCIFHWTRRAGGILPASQCEYLSLFEKNFDLMCNFSNYSNSACLVIINHKHKTKVHRLKLC